MTLGIFVAPTLNKVVQRRLFPRRLLRHRGLSSLRESVNDIVHLSKLYGSRYTYLEHKLHKMTLYALVARLHLQTCSLPA